MKKIATVASNNIREVPTAFCQNSSKYIEEAYWSQFFIYLFRSFTIPTFERAASKGFPFSSKSKQRHGDFMAFQFSKWNQLIREDFSKVHLALGPLLLIGIFSPVDCLMESGSHPLRGAFLLWKLFKILLLLGWLYALEIRLTLTKSLSSVEPGNFLKIIYYSQQLHTNSTFT